MQVRSSGRADEAHFGTAKLDSDACDLLIIAPGQLEMHLARVRVDCRCGRGGLFSRTPFEISQVNFHRRHPRWPAKRYAPRESLHRSYPHSIDARVNGLT